MLYADDDSGGCGGKVINTTAECDGYTEEACECEAFRLYSYHARHFE